MSAKARICKKEKLFWSFTACPFQEVELTKPKKPWKGGEGRGEHSCLFLRLYDFFLHIFENNLRIDIFSKRYSESFLAVLIYQSTDYLKNFRLVYK